MPMMEDRWLDPPIDNEWTARQVIRFHERGDMPCVACAGGLVCPRLARARKLVGDGSTTDPSTIPTRESTVRP